MATIEILKSLAYIGGVSSGGSAARISKSLGYVSILSSDGKTLLAKTLAYTSTNPSVNRLLLAKSLSYVTTNNDVEVPIPKVTVSDLERNPYRAHLSDSEDERLEDAREQQRTIRQQHNLTQAGDSTFDFGLLFKLYPNKEFTPGSLGKFFHDEYGMIHARFVRFYKFLSRPHQGQPVGRVKDSAETVDWLVTNNIDLSNPDWIGGFTFLPEVPTDDYYGWMVVSGCNPTSIEVESSEIPVENDAYSWTSSGRVSLKARGKILGRRAGPSQVSELDPGTLMIGLEGASDADVAATIEVATKPISDKIDSTESKITDLKDRVTANESDIGALKLVDAALTTRLATEETTRAREIASLRATYTPVDYSQDIFNLGVELRNEIEAGDSSVKIIADNALELATSLQTLVLGLDTGNLAQHLDNLSISISTLTSKWGGLYFDTETIPLADGQVFITSHTTNSDGNDTYKLDPIDYKLRKLLDYDDTTPPTNEQYIVWDSGLSKFKPFTPVRRYSVAFGYTTTPTVSEIMLIHVFAEAVDFSANYAGSRGSVSTNPAASFVLTLTKNGSAAGTITVSTGGVSTFATPGGTAISFGIGDVLRVTAPSPVDTTIANCAFTLLGVRA